MQGQPVREVAAGLPCLAVGPVVAGLRGAPAASDGTATRPPGRASHVLVVGEVVDAGEAAGGRQDDGGPGVLRMEDTRMNYGG